MPVKSKLQLCHYVEQSVDVVFNWLAHPSFFVTSLQSNTVVVRQRDSSTLELTLNRFSLFPKKCTVALAIVKEKRALVAECTQGIVKGARYHCLVEQVEGGQTVVREEIEWEGQGSARDQKVRSLVTQLAKRRKEVLQQELERAAHDHVDRPLKVLISGSHGLIGAALLGFLQRAGHEVWRLVRRPSDATQTVFWDPEKKEATVADFEGFDAVVHLEGENIAQGRWTKKKKKRIADSRIATTHFLASLLSQLAHPPEVWICASAIGIYGDRKGEWLEEDNVKPSPLFLAQLCQSWEAASRQVTLPQLRVVQARFGIVLSHLGGALVEMMKLFHWGLGSVIGSGQHDMSWIAHGDAIGALYHILIKKNVRGPVNCVAPSPVPQRVFAQILANRLGCRLLLWIPAFGLRLLLGQKGKELLLTSLRVRPNKLIETGYSFDTPSLYRA